MKNIHLQLRNLIGQIESAMIQGEALMYRQVKILLQDSEISLSAKFHSGFIPPSHGIKLTVWLYVRLFSVNVGLLISREGGSVPPSISGGTASLLVCRSHSWMWVSAFLAILSRRVSRCNRSFRLRSSS